MTITVTDIVAGPFTATGLSQVAPFAFMALSDGEVEVVYGDEETVLSPLLYSVNRNEDLVGLPEEGGDVTIDAGAITAGAQFLVRAAPNIEQEQQWSDTGSRLRNLNFSLDRLTMIALRMRYDLDRGITGADAALAQVEALAASVAQQIADAPNLVGNKLDRDGGNPAPDFLSNVGAASAADLDADIARQPVYAEQYGAVGNGVTSDAAAINAAAAAAGARKVPLRLKSGRSYLMGSTQLVTPDGLEVEAEGAELVFSSQINAVKVGAGASWNGGHVKGPGGANYNAAGIGMVCRGVENPGSPPTVVDGPNIRGVTVSGFGYAGIWCQYCADGSVTDCETTDLGYVGIAGVSVSAFRIDDNIIRSVKGAGAPDTYGIFYSADEGTEVENPRVTQSSICGNIIDDVPNHEGIDLHGDTEIVIAKNILTRVKTGIAVVGGDTSGSPARGSRQVVVSGNSVTGLGTGDGITISGVTAEKARGVVVSGNTVRDCGSDGDIYAGAVRIVNATGVSVTGNVISAPRCWGIALFENVVGVTVTGNTVVNPRDDTITVPSCVVVLGDNVKGLISDNTFVYDAATAGGTYRAVQSIRIGASLTGLDLDIGRHSLIGIDASHLSFSLGTATGVNFHGFVVQSGQATLALTNTGSVLYTVNFPKRFPSVPTGAFLTVSGSLIPGSVAKMPILAANAISETQLEIIARAFDLTAFGGSGNLVVNWMVTT